MEQMSNFNVDKFKEEDSNHANIKMLIKIYKGKIICQVGKECWNYF